MLTDLLSHIKKKNIFESLYALVIIEHNRNKGIREKIKINFKRI